MAICARARVQGPDRRSSSPYAVSPSLSKGIAQAQGRPSLAPVYTQDAPSRVCRFSHGAGPFGCYAQPYPLNGHAHSLPEASRPPLPIPDWPWPELTTWPELTATSTRPRNRTASESPGHSHATGPRHLGLGEAGRQHRSPGPLRAPPPPFPSEPPPPFSSSAPPPPSVAAALFGLPPAGGEAGPAEAGAEGAWEPEVT